MNVCRSLGMVEGAPKEGRAAEPVSDLTLLGVYHDGLLYCRTKAGDRVTKGQHLADVRSWDGTVLQRIEAPFDGIVEITVNWLPVRSGEYALAMVKPAS
jgi:predicted deacylase